VLDDHFARAVLTAFFVEDGDGITGFIEEFRGVSAHGKILKEARTRLTASARKHLEENQEGVRQRMESYGTVTRERQFVDITRVKVTAVNYPSRATIPGHDCRTSFLSRCRAEETPFGDAVVKPSALPFHRRRSQLLFTTTNK
jgi:hypothetical protein